MRVLGAKSQEGRLLGEGCLLEDTWYNFYSKLHEQDVIFPYREGETEYLAL